jgi:hypothetical protein
MSDFGITLCFKTNKSGFRELLFNYTELHVTIYTNAIKMKLEGHIKFSH